MLKRFLNYSALLIVLSSVLIAEPLVPYRAWQFHELDYEYVSLAMKLAPQYNINTVIFSHGMIWETSQLYDGTDRGQQLKQLATEAHYLGMRVWIWTHEFDNVPDKYLDNDIVQMDRVGFWDWLAERYQKVFTDYAEFDGIILTFHETQYRIFRDSEVNSKLSEPDRFAKMIRTMYSVCKKYNKDFVVRTFLYELQELELLKQGLLNSDPGVIVQSKCVPHDWDPYYPQNPVIGAFPNNKQIVEFDCSSEFTGRNRIPYTSPEYFEYRWRYNLKQTNIIGYNARVDHAGYDAIYTPNEINLYTLYRLTEDKNITANDIWKEWTEKRYGRQAAPAIEKALFPTFHVVNKAFFLLKFWITNHSVLPDFNYADGHISSRTIAKWIPNKPIYKELEMQLNQPDPQILETILAEKDSAIALANEALLHLQEAKPYLTAGQYDDLYWRLDILNRAALIWKLHAEAFFGYKVLAEGHDVPGLAERTKRAINGLYRQADVSDKNSFIGDLPPGSAKEIRQVADELKEKMMKLKVAAGN
jgi:hypothetical protein